MEFIKSYPIENYFAPEVCGFKKTKETFGELSNMAAGFPVEINGEKIRSVEALYQACRFPDYPDIQKKIIQEKSPMTAKMVSKSYIKYTRPDFDTKKIDIMRWCLQVKLAFNFEHFASILAMTQNKSIVEISHKDSFWGAIPQKNNSNLLVGANILGNLLMDLRNNLSMSLPAPPSIDKFLFLNTPIEIPDIYQNYYLEEEEKSEEEWLYRNFLA